MKIAINLHIKKLQALCEKHKVASLYLFGSATGSSFNEQSDIDFLVSFKPIDLADYFSNYMSLKNKLKELFNREVDLVEQQTLKNPILLHSINQNKQLIYG
ncbi:MAG: nucleotidyltransferase domain-containing protein [Flavobacteriaceae bacterium]|nr:nucleotidyltransferase domain-containing protein [Flavobacteriaceae bacterium]